jgi:unsaturated rhamnogalacturonyl hydrolase
MKKILCILAGIFLNVAAPATAKLTFTIGEKFDKKQTIKIANEVAGDVLSRPVDAKYPTVCSYYGVLKFAETTKNAKLIDAVKANYAASPITAQDIFYSDDKSVGADKRKSPRTDRIRSGHVDWNVFGILPFELYLQTKDQQYLKVATALAEDEWAEPNQAGLTAYTRFWVDDMFMVGALQVQAYKALNNPVYLERGLTQLLAYAKTLQRQNGLFQHTANAPVFWGRGNGWAAAVMAMTLENMPKEHPKRQELMDVYKKMMTALKKYQDTNGLWHQIIIDPQSYEETSSSAMFTYAIATGIKNGWLDNSFRKTALKGWKALLRKTVNGQVSDVCIGTSEGKSYDHYLNRPTKTGDLHGQAPLLWAAAAMLQLYQ